jgi:peptidoglycan/LPS O-acetylase OafA/YrhL
MTVSGSIFTTSTTPVRPSALAALANGEIAGLDGLRAISVLCVMVAHYGFGNLVPGGLGVTVFFFISGFLITTLMLREAHATGGVAIGRFYVRRVLRLQPELWALLLISGIGGIAVSYWPTMLDVIGSLFYVSNYINEGVFSAAQVPDPRWRHLWSLAVEEHFYLIYPLLFVALIKWPARLMALLVAVLVGALALRFVYFGHGVDTETIYSLTETRIDSIAYGCLASLALWYLPESFAHFIRRNRTAIGSFALVLLGASVVLRGPMFRDTLRYSVQGAALILLAANLYCNEKPGLATRLLDVPVLKWMGRLSYGAYLWHLEIGSSVEHLLHLPSQSSPSLQAAIEAPGLVALSFGAAWLSYELFQRPVAGLRRRFGAEARPAIILGQGEADLTGNVVHAEIDRR